MIHTPTTGIMSGTAGSSYYFPPLSPPPSHHNNSNKHSKAKDLPPQLQPIIESELDVSIPAVLFAEFLASMFYVFLCGSLISITGTLDGENRTFLRILTIALVEGFVFYALIYMVMKLTRGRSGYFNSALTLSLCFVDLYLDRGHSFLKHSTRAMLHIISQLIGSLLGAILIVLLIPHAMDGQEKTGVGGPALDVMNEYGTFFIEVIFSSFLVLILLSIRNNENKKSSLLLVFAMVLLRLVLFPTTGSMCNPNRALAHAIIADIWNRSIWIFVVAPVIGAILATFGFIAMHRQDLD